jgi:hypothetical protein
MDKKSKKNIDKFVKNKYTSNSLKNLLINKSFEFDNKIIHKYFIEYINSKKK